MHRPSELVGKTIKDIWLDEEDKQLQVWFTDGTKLTIDPSASWGDRGFLSLNMRLTNE